MTEKQTMERLRNVGLGYRKIAIVLDLSRDKVRNYCKANGLDDYAKKRLQAKEGKQMEEDCADSVCRYCGKPIEKQTTRRKRIYCLEECRRAWSKNHLPLYKHECMFCGKKFESSSKTQKFCSHDCYIRDRFWRKNEEMPMHVETTKARYVEVLEFTHFVVVFTFHKLGENHKEKELVRKVTVVVALDLGTGNTKNLEERIQLSQHHFLV